MQKCVTFFEIRKDTAIPKNCIINLQTKKSHYNFAKTWSIFNFVMLIFVK